MDFSSPSRALLSLERRQPPLPKDIIAISTSMFAAWNLMQRKNEDSAAVATFLDGIWTLLSSENLRWEALAVGVYCATGLLESQSFIPEEESSSPVSIEVSTKGASVPALTAHLNPSITTMPCTNAMGTMNITLSEAQTLKLATILYETCSAHLEHKEPRIRTLVAKAVEAHGALLICTSKQHESEITYTTLVQQCSALHKRIASSIDDHILRGRDDLAPEDEPQEELQVSETNFASEVKTPKLRVLDDTTGWRALETNWQCLACLIQSLGSLYFDLFALLDSKLLSQCQVSATEHVSRHVRAAAILALEQWVRAAAYTNTTNKNMNDVHPALLNTVTQVLKEGLADNWSQVRLAASVLCRILLVEYLPRQPPADTAQHSIYAVVIPRMCLNRFYLAPGVKLYSHDTWRLAFPNQGLALVSKYLGAVCRYYVRMADTNNHIVREVSCHAIAEVATKMAKHDSELLQPYVGMLLQTLLMCFHDEAWPVQDAACVACGIFCKAYPQECQVELTMLWERWTEQLTNQIWSVRENAAIALGDAVDAYGKEMMIRCLELVKKLLPSAKKEPAVTMAEYKAKQNNVESHSNTHTLSSKSSALRFGCSSCLITRPKAPWEATDGIIYLLRELIVRGSDTQNPSQELTLTDDTLLPVMTELVDVCRVQHFPQSDDLRTTLWKQLPVMAQILGKNRFKRYYVDMFLDLLMNNLERNSASTLSKHAAAQCAEQLAQLIGMSIFRGRLDDYQQATFDTVMRERQHAIHKQGTDNGSGSLYMPPGSMDPFITNTGGRSSSK